MMGENLIIFPDIENNRNIPNIQRYQNYDEDYFFKTYAPGMQAVINISIS